MEAANDDAPREKSRRVFVFGCGYSAGRFARGLRSGEVEGVTTRDATRAASFAARGLTPFLFDGESAGEGIDAALFRTTHLLVSIPPDPDAQSDREGDPVLRWYRDALLHGAPSLRWIGYLSTVGVYGDHGGAAVDEMSEVRPGSDRSRARLAAEQTWQDIAGERGVPLAILRLSGIYGPGRNAFRNLLEGKARRIVKPGQVFNRIHVEDIAAATEHLSQGGLGGVFNVTDDEAAPPETVVEAAAAMVGAPLPPAVPFEEAALSPMARSFYGENKRVSNAALKATGYTFRYPTYREGLEALRGEYETR